MDTNTTIEVVTTVTYIYFVYLLLALLIERTLEVLVAIYNYLELKVGWDKTWDRKAEHYRARLGRLYEYQGEAGDIAHKLFNWVLWKVIAERPYEGGKEQISADLVRLSYFRVTTRLVAFLISFVLVFSQWHQLDIITIIQDAIAKGAIPDTLKPIVSNLSRNEALRLVITAAAISIGSEPLHQLIGKIEQRIASKSVSTSGGAQ
jgi:hypothetical protein